MNYQDGRDIKLGDQILYGASDCGYVVCNIDGKQFSPEFTEIDWAYLKSGVLIRTAGSGIIHIKAPDADLTLVRRNVM
jgi:hypothetical protein